MSCYELKGKDTQRNEFFFVKFEEHRFAVTFPKYFLIVSEIMIGSIRNK